MGSTHTPKDSFDPAELADLEAAFRSIWTVIQGHDPFRDTTYDEELQLALRRKIFALASNGVHDPSLMRGAILETFLPLKTQA